MQKIRDTFLSMYHKEQFNEAGLLEIIGASFIANEPAIFGIPDLTYITKEINWYNSKSLNIFDMYNPPKLWTGVANEEGCINSNYGWCIFSKENGRQLGNVITKLRNNPNTKRATMIYTRPSMHTDAIADGKNDFICTNAVAYSVKEGKLNVVVQMRSNDAVYGFKNDYAWQKYVQELVCKELNYLPGVIYWQAASLHIYPRHFKILDNNLRMKSMAGV